jgi:hypothetical protein
MYKRENPIDDKDHIDHIDDMYFINVIRNFLGKEPIESFNAKKNKSIENAWKNRKRKKKGT